VLVPALVFAIVGVVLIAVARFWPRAPVPIQSQSQSRAGVTSLSREAELTGPAVVHVPYTWIHLVDADLPLELDPLERRRLAEGLGVVGEPWCADALALAYQEEDDEMRDVIVGAIGTCTGSVDPTLALALRSDRSSQRLLALEAFARRHNVEMLDAGLADREESVALVAAVELVRAGEAARVEAYFADLTDAVRAQSMRGVLATLAA
jgi:hypothetical protein